MSRKRNKLDVVEEFAKVIRLDGCSEITPEKFEERLKSYVQAKGYVIEAFGKNYLDTKMSDSVKYTLDKVKDGTIKNLELDPATGDYKICPDKWDKAQATGSSKKQAHKRGESVDDYIGVKGNAGSYKSFEDTYKDAPEYHAPASAEYNPEDKVVLDFKNPSNISAILSAIFIIVIAVRLIMAVVTKEPISTQFWAWYIALATTKGMIMDGKDIHVAGRIFFIVIVWLAASNFI